MANDDNPRMQGISDRPPPPKWVCALLGALMILAGFLVLGDVVLFTVVSALFIGWMAIAVGIFEIVHAFWTKGWGGFVWQILLGILYVAFGIIVLRQPLASALALTYVLGLVLLFSGLIRVVIGVGRWRQQGWVMLVSGVFGVIAGLIILSEFPESGLWVLGVLLGIDLLTHGVAWLTYSWRSPVARAQPAAMPG
jgi:uncharacterized membrane protein HdeD (DUF308 family)